MDGQTDGYHTDNEETAGRPAVQCPVRRCVWSCRQGLLAAQKESENKELLAKLHQERMDGTFQRDMLQYLIQDKVDIEIDDSLLTHRDGRRNNRSRC